MYRSLERVSSIERGKIRVRMVIALRGKVRKMTLKDLVIIFALACVSKRR